MLLSACIGYLCRVHRRTRNCIHKTPVYAEHKYSAVRSESVRMKHIFTFGPRRGGLLTLSLPPIRHAAATITALRLAGRRRRVGGSGSARADGCASAGFGKKLAGVRDSPGVSAAAVAPSVLILLLL